MTQASDRDEARRPNPRPVRDERPVRMAKPGQPRVMRPPTTQPPQGPERDRTAWSKAAVIVNVVLILAVAIVGVRYTQTHHGDSSDEADQGLTVRDTTTPSDAASTSASTAPSTAPSTAASASASTSPSASAGASGGTAASAGPVTTPAPTVKTKMRSDFSDGDPFPYGADIRGAGSLSFPMGIVNGLMTHGAPTGSSAVSWLEKWTTTDVRRIGARIQFAPNHSGAAILTAWYTSVLKLSGTAQPKTGMRLVATPGHWQLVALTGSGSPAVLAQGDFAQKGRTASFDLVRTGSTVWVTDPAGTVTQVQDPRIQRFSGPWASWELREDKAGERPAGFAEIWAG